MRGISYWHLERRNRWPYIAIASHHSQTVEQVSGEIVDPRFGSTECKSRVVSEGHDSRIWQGFRQEVLQPKLPRPWVCPGLLCRAIQAMNCNDTTSLVSREPETSEYGGAYSTSAVGRATPRFGFGWRMYK